MNKLTIPSILAATVLIAGIFAFMPVEKASTVHTGLGTQLRDIQADVDDIKADFDAINANTMAPASRTLTLTDEEVTDNEDYALHCFNTAYVFEGISLDISGLNTPATLTLMQTSGITDIVGTGEGIGETNTIMYEAADRGPKVLNPMSDWIDGMTDDAIEIMVVGASGTDLTTDIKVTIQAPSTAVCSLT